jgi:hypothetical protein
MSQWIWPNVSLLDESFLKLFWLSTIDHQRKFSKHAQLPPANTNAGPITRFFFLGAAASIKFEF